MALQAQNDLTTAYNQAAGQAPDVTYTGDPVELGGQTLVPGVYKVPVSAQITGTLTLNGQGNPNAVWVFQVGSSLTTASNSSVSFINGANPCNVYWQIGSSATLGTGTRFVGNVLALTSITANTNTTVNGRLLARNGAVTLDSNTIFQGECGPTPTGTATPTPTGTATPTPTGTATPTPTGTATPTPTGGGDHDEGKKHDERGDHDEGKKHDERGDHDEGKKHDERGDHDEGKKHDEHGDHDEGKKHDEHETHGWTHVAPWSGR